MPRGQKMVDGTITEAQNGYRYIYINGKRKALHWHIAELARGGKEIDSETERVIFLDKDRHNLDPTNILIVKRKENKSLRKHRIIDQIANLVEEYYMLQDDEDGLQEIKNIVAKYER